MALKIIKIIQFLLTKKRSKELTAKRITILKYNRIRDFPKITSRIMKSKDSLIILEINNLLLLLMSFILRALLRIEMVLIFRLKTLKNRFIPFLRLINIIAECVLIETINKGHLNFRIISHEHQLFRLGEFFKRLKFDQIFPDLYFLAAYSFFAKKETSIKNYVLNVFNNLFYLVLLKLAKFRM